MLRDAMLAAVFAAAAAAEVKNGITVLTDDSFDKFAADNAAFGLVVYAPWCGHSRELLPKLERVARELGDKLPLAKVDGTEAEALATRLDVKGYPTVFFVRDGRPHAYSEAHEAAPIKQWLQQRANPPVKALGTAAELAEFAKKGRESGAKLAAVLFGSAGTPEHAAFLDVAGGASFPCALADPALAASEGQTGLTAPALVLYTSFDGGRAVLSGAGELTAEGMARFVKTESLPLVVPYTKEVEAAVFGGDVRTHLLVLYTGAPPPASALEPAAKRLRGTVVFCLIDAAKHADVADFFDAGRGGALGGVWSGTPAALAFRLSTGVKYLHRGALEAEAVGAFLDSVLAGKEAPFVRSQPEPAQSGPVVELVGSSFRGAVDDGEKDVLVQFYAPDCGHCAKLKPTYLQVAEHFASDGELVVAQIDATVNDVLGFEPEGYPTIVFYPKANKRGVEYDGSRDAHDIIQFVGSVRAGTDHTSAMPEAPTPDGDDETLRVEL